MPTPSTMGGQGLAPASSTVSLTKATMSSGEAAGVIIFRRLMFSLPKPLGATVRVSLSPGTSRVWRMAGVLSPVLPRRRGSCTTEHRSRPST